MNGATPAPDKPLNPSFHAYPEPIETNIPWTEPPPGHNPVIRGLPLVIASKFVAAISPLSKFLYNNAGFDVVGKLKELDGFEARYVPVVVPKADNNAGAGDFNATAESSLRVSRGASGDAGKSWWSVRDYVEEYKSGRATPTQVVEALLPLIRRDVDKRHKHSVAFLQSRVDLIQQAAAASTLRWKEGKPLGVLDGVPVAVKDEVDLTGYKKSYASAQDHTSKKDVTSWCVAQWQREGAIVVGKASMHELGMDTSCLNPVHGTPLNPYNDEYYTGGSSGGSGYAVSAGLVPIALGVDGGGSIRIPSAYCGVYGLKPSHARVSDWPTAVVANSNCVVGPMAADMSSLEVAYRVMATPNPNHPISSLFPVPQPLTQRPPKTLGIFKEWLNRADPAVKTITNNAIAYLTTSLGYTTVDISIPLMSEGQTAHALTILNEAVAAVPDWRSLSAPNRVLFAVGAHASASEFIKAQQLRGLLMSHLAFMYKKHPGLIIVTPVSPNAGWAIKSPSDLKYGCSDGDMSVKSMEYVWIANFSGCPCLTFPAGYVKPEKGVGDVPVGVMGMAEWGAEETLIEFGFDGEEYLHKGYEGGRQRPANWTDVLGSVGSGAVGEETKS